MPAPGYLHRVTTPIFFSAVRSRLKRRTAVRSVRLVFAAALAGLVTGCATGGPPDALPAPTPEARWPVKAAPHVDLWLHTFGMLTTDTTPVPLFRRGYRDSMTVLRNRANAFTTLDANRNDLAPRLGAGPAAQGAQFLIFSFPSWEALRLAIDNFIRAEGDPRRLSNQESAREVAFLAAQFPSAADREWLRKLAVSVEDERSAFYQDFWQNAQRDRLAVIDAVNALWQNTYREQFARYLSNTGQRNGEILLSLPLGAEGRATGGSGYQIIAVPMPGRVADAAEAMVVFAHEAVGSITGAAVADNTTPAQKRTGESNRMVAMAQVLGGLELVQRVAPDLAVPYATYYLAQVGRPAPRNTSTAGLAAALAAAFPTPAPVLQTIARQIELSLGGI